MRLTVRSPNLEIDPAVRAALQRRLHFVLGRFGPRIGSVSVHLADLNGPRGGVNKRCRIVVRLLRAGQLFVEDTDSDLGAVVDRATERIGQSVRRELERWSKRENGSGAATDRRVR